MVDGMRNEAGDVAPVTITRGHTTMMTLCVCGATFRESGDDEDVLRKHAAWSREHADCVKPPYEAKTYWLSFCDADRPKGQQFLGACIVDVSPAEVEDALIEVLVRFPLAQPGAEYIAAAVKKAHRLGCNPGGEVATIEIDRDNPNLARYQKGVLMDRATCEALDDPA